MSNQHAMIIFLNLKSELSFIASMATVNLRRDHYEQVIVASRAWLALPSVERQAILMEQVITPAIQIMDATPRKIPY